MQLGGALSAASTHDGEGRAGRRGEVALRADGGVQDAEARARADAAGPPRPHRGYAEPQALNSFVLRCLWSERNVIGLQDVVKVQNGTNLHGLPN